MGNETWAEQQQFISPSSEEDMEALPDVPVQVSEQGETQDQTRRRQGGTSELQATEPQALQPTSRRMQQSGSRCPANYGRLFQGGDGHGVRRW